MRDVGLGETRDERRECDWRTLESESAIRQSAPAPGRGGAVTQTCAPGLRNAVNLARPRMDKIIAISAPLEGYLSFEAQV